MYSIEDYQKINKIYWITELLLYFVNKMFDCFAAS